MGVMVALAIAGCKADDPTGDGDGDGDVDAGPSGELAPPVLDPIPDTTPLSTVAVRGSTNGTRIVAQNTAIGSVLASVLPGGSFCLDASLHSDGTPTEMKLYSIGGDGRISEPVDVVSSRDPGAPEPSDPTCSASGEIDCTGAENCNNGDVDDDCNGLADACDNACNGCIEDLFEPNDVPIDVPMIQAGGHTLQICPCRNDWFAYTRNVGQRIAVTATFNGAAIDIDLRLHRAAPGGAGTDGVVASSLTVSNTETIDFTVDMAGVYYLEIFSPSGDQTGSYNFDTN